MWDKVGKALNHVCEWLETFMALVVFAGVVVAAAALVPELMHLSRNAREPGAFLSYLEDTSSVVIGIEFMKMLCRPSSANVIEVLVFLIARHMIVHTTTPLEDLLSVISIGILFFFRRYMMATKPDKSNHVPSLVEAIRHPREAQKAHAVQKAREALAALEALDTQDTHVLNREQPGRRE